MSLYTTSRPVTSPPARAGGRIAVRGPAGRARAAAPDAPAESQWVDDSRAGPRSKRPENAAGAFWVDSKCIDCDTCR